MPLDSVWSPRSQEPFASCDADAIAARLGCPAPVARLLAARGFAEPSAAERFLNPTLDAFLSDPAHSPNQLLGMTAAVARIFAALETAQPILIYGDYDVDGTTATVLLKTTLERIALALHPATPADVRYHIPHRIHEGYGMQRSVLARAAAEGIRLVISVDTGIRAFAEAAEARALGLDLIVTDHHLPDEYRAPDCLAVINPAQPGCPYPNKHLCGAAVAFKLAHALLTAAAPRTPDPEPFRARTERTLIPSFLKMVAIATVADAVPLTGENRLITALGLAALANPVQPGLRALMQFAKLPLDRAPSATEVAFRLAPRINAAGRMDVASEVIELFLTRDVERARTLAAKLDALNQARRDSETAALDAIDERLAALLGDDGEYPPDCVILDHPEWHRGVLGILASRVVERTHRPALVISHAEGDAHGSGRSIPGFHLLDALVAAEDADSTDGLFHRFGGHAHAVGFSLPSERVAQLRDRISAHAAKHLSADILIRTRSYDTEIGMHDLTPALGSWVERLAPFGHGNPEPVFLLRNAHLSAPPRIIKERHISLDLALPGSSPTTVAALGWSRSSEAKNWAERCAGLTTGCAVDLLVRLRRRTGAYANAALNGLELELEDLRTAAGRSASITLSPVSAVATEGALQ